MAPEKDYTRRSWIAVTLLIAVLIGLSLIPPQTLGGVSLRRANILSDLISFEEDLEKAEKANAATIKTTAGPGVNPKK